MQQLRAELLLLLKKSIHTVKIHVSKPTNQMCLTVFNCIRDLIHIQVRKNYLLSHHLPPPYQLFLINSTHIPPSHHTSNKIITYSV